MHPRGLPRGHPAHARRREYVPGAFRGTREINEKAIVQLKKTSILSLDPAGIDGTIIVTGNAATQIPLAGGGSAQVEGFDNKSYLQALQEVWGVEAPFEGAAGGEREGLVVPMKGSVNGRVDKDTKVVGEKRTVDADMSFWVRDLR